jgi:hypothetical protein
MVNPHKWLNISSSSKNIFWGYFFNFHATKWYEIFNNDLIKCW